MIIDQGLDHRVHFDLSTYFWCFSLSPSPHSLSPSTLSITEYECVLQSYGWFGSGTRMDCAIPNASRHWLSMSARECMASESMAADPVYSVAISLNTNTAKLLYIVEKQTLLLHSPATGCSQASLPCNGVEDNFGWPPEKGYPLSSATKHLGDCQYTRLTSEKMIVHRNFRYH